MQNNPADELNIKMPHIHGAHRGFSDSGKGLRKYVIQGFTLLDALLEDSCLGLEFLIT